MSQNRITDQFAKFVTDAMGAAQGVAKEVETAVKSQGEKLVSKMDLPTREEFDALKDLVVKLSNEVESMKKQQEPEN